MSTSDETSDGSVSEPRLRVVRQSEEDMTTISDETGDYNIKLLQPLFAYIRAKHDSDTLADIIHDCGLPRNAADRKAGWISHDRFEHFLASARELVESDEEFMRMCAYEMKKQYGAFILILRCMSVQSTYEVMSKSSHMVCKVGTFSTTPGPLNSARVFYETTKAESRLNCLSRQASITHFPTLFLGQAPARLKEHSCVARGDERCEYELSWYQPLRLRRLAAGMAVGLLGALGLPEATVEPWLAYSMLPLLGGAIGTTLELRRLLMDHSRFVNQTTLEMEKVIVAHAQATDELTSLRERERDWNRHVEEGVATRTRKLNAVVDRLRAIIRNRSGSFPVVQKSPDSQGNAFQDGTPALPPSTERIASMETAVNRVSQLVGELVTIASSDTTKRNLETEEVSVDKLVAQIRRQLKATMIGRNVRITVFQTREAPATITTIRPILDRVIDNVLLNASRHTERGSVVVEASGTPGSLLIKLSDTGSGISKERLEQVFDDNNSSSNKTASGGGLGASNDRSGLAYAARLLDHLGGRLEIMSEPGVGTTLWLYIPATPAEQDAPKDDDEPKEEDSIVGRVVRIRSNLNPAAKLDPES